MPRLSNYPPGVTGNEREIAGEIEREDGDFCEYCGVPLKIERAGDLCWKCNAELEEKREIVQK